MELVCWWVVEGAEASNGVCTEAPGSEARTSISVWVKAEPSSGPLVLLRSGGPGRATFAAEEDG